MGDDDAKKVKKEDKSSKQKDTPTAPPPTLKDAVHPVLTEKKKKEDTPKEDSSTPPKKKKKKEDTPNERIYVIRSNNDEEMPSAQFNRYRIHDFANRREKRGEYVETDLRGMPSAQFKTDLRGDPVLIRNDDMGGDPGFGIDQPGPQWREGLFSDGDTRDEEDMPPVGSFEDDFWMDKEGVEKPGGGGGYDRLGPGQCLGEDEWCIVYSECLSSSEPCPVGFPPPFFDGEYDNNYDNNNNGRYAGIYEYDNDFYY